MPRVTLKKVNKAIQAKYPGVKIMRGHGGYLYVGAIDTESDIATKIAGLYQTTISGMSYRLNSVPVERWVQEVEYVLRDSYLMNEFDRNPAI